MSEPLSCFGTRAAICSGPTGTVPERTCPEIDRSLRGSCLPRVAALIVLSLCLVACRLGGEITVTPGTINSAQAIADDMRLAHEGHPHGVPASFDWARGPRIGMGNDPRGFRALIAWGQLYEDAEGNPAANTRVQIRDMRAYVLSVRDGQWHLAQRAQRVEGAAYREDFAGDANRPADVRVGEDGSISVTAGDGHNFHFWPSTGRVSMIPTTLRGCL